MVTVTVTVVTGTSTSSDSGSRAHDDPALNHAVGIDRKTGPGAVAPSEVVLAREDTHGIGASVRRIEGESCAAFPRAAQAEKSCPFRHAIDLDRTRDGRDRDVDVEGQRRLTDKDPTSNQGDFVDRGGGSRAQEIIVQVVTAGDYERRLGASDRGGGAEAGVVDAVASEQDEYALTLSRRVREQSAIDRDGARDLRGEQIDVATRAAAVAAHSDCARLGARRFSAAALATGAPDIGAPASWLTLARLRRSAATRRNQNCYVTPKLLHRVPRVIEANPLYTLARSQTQSRRVTSACVAINVSPFRTPRPAHSHLTMGDIFRVATVRNPRPRGKCASGTPRCAEDTTSCTKYFSGGEGGARATEKRSVPGLASRLNDLTNRERRSVCAASERKC